MTSQFVRRVFPFALLPLIGAVLPARPAVVAPNPVHGRYVEVRTASVFAGACHYNGERVTEGRSALLAWDIAGGAFNHSDLTGTKILAAVSCDDNLAEPAARRSELLVDADSDAHTAAAVQWVKSRCGSQLGNIAAVRRGPILFHESEGEFTVSAPQWGEMAVRPMPNHECCTQPHLVWYQPLMPIENRRVGYTETAAYDAAHIGQAWQRADENSAFYGSFVR